MSQVKGNGAWKAPAAFLPLYEEFLAKSKIFPSQLLALLKSFSSRRGDCQLLWEGSICYLSMKMDTRIGTVCLITGWIGE